MNDMSPYSMGFVPRIHHSETATVTLTREEYAALLAKIKRLEQCAYESSWRENPGRMGS